MKNETNKLNLTNEIEGLVTSGFKNFYVALNTSFDILDQFKDKEEFLEEMKKLLE